MHLSDDFLDVFEDDIARLSRRRYAEVGVPMFLIPEDLSRPTAAPGAPGVAADPQGADLADAFASICAALARRNGPLTTRDLGHVMEVLADRRFLDVPFSSLSAPDAPDGRS